MCFGVEFFILFSDLGGPPKMHAQMLTCVVNSNEQKTLTESRNSFLTIKERPQMCGELGSDFHVYKSS